MKKKLRCAAMLAVAVMLARFAAEDSSVRISQAAVSHADFDGDGNVTGSDVIVILRYIAKLI